MFNIVAAELIFAAVFVGGHGRDLAVAAVEAAGVRRHRAHDRRPVRVLPFSKTLVPRVRPRLPARGARRARPRADSDPAPAEWSSTSPACRIRSWRAGDEPSLARHADNRKIWLNVRDRFPHPYTLADAESWLAKVTAAEPETQFAIEVDGEAAGGVGLFLQEDVSRFSAEIGYWLGEAYWGRGLDDGGRARGSPTTPSRPTT